MLVTETIGNVRDKHTDKKIIPVSFAWFELEKKRMRKMAEDGTEIGIRVSHPMQHGDILAETADALYAVQVMETRLIRIPVSTMQEMGRLGFELGNRHLSLRITERDITVPYDQPTYEYLRKLGFQAEEVTERFTDFIECRAHGHSHGHAEEAGAHSHSHAEGAGVHSHHHDEEAHEMHRHHHVEQEQGE